PGGIRFLQTAHTSSRGLLAIPLVAIEPGQVRVTGDIGNDGRRLLADRAAPLADENWRSGAQHSRSALGRLREGRPAADSENSTAGLESPGTAAARRAFGRLGVTRSSYRSGRGTIPLSLGPAAFVNRGVP